MTSNQIDRRLYGRAEDELLDNDEVVACDRIGGDMGPGSHFKLIEWSTRAPDVIPDVDAQIDRIIEDIADTDDILDHEVAERYVDHFRTDPSVRFDVEWFVRRMRDHAAMVDWRWTDKRLRTATVTVPEAGESWVIEWETAT